MSDDYQRIYNLVQSIYDLAEVSIDRALAKANALKLSCDGLTCVALHALSADINRQKHDYQEAYNDVCSIKCDYTTIENALLRSLCYKVLGDVYSVHHLYRNANDVYLDAVYHEGHRQRNNYKALFYYKIALNYVAMDDDLMAEGYFLRALENYDKNNLCPLTMHLEAAIYGGLIRASIHANRLEYVVRRLTKLEMMAARGGRRVQIEFLFSQLNYLIYCEDDEVLEGVFGQGLEWLQNNAEAWMVLRYAGRYYDYLVRRHVDPHVIADGIETCLDLIDDQQYSRMYQQLLKMLMQAYREIGECDKALAVYRKHVDVVKRGEAYLKDLSKQSLIVYQTQFFDNKEHKIIGEKDTKIEEHNDILDRESMRLKMISDIGKMIVDSSDYKSISDIIINYLSEDFSIDILSLVMCDEQADQLVYLTHFKCDEYGVLPPIHMSDEYSFFAECVKTRQFIYINDIAKRYTREELDKYHIDETDVKSLLFCPIFYEEQVIGAYSFQSHRVNAYDMIDVKLIKEIATFLAISIINTKKAVALGMVESELLVLNENLKNAQNQFELTKYQDGLTKIYNRRHLEQNYRQFVELAQKRGKVVALYLIDIDDFDAYNKRHGNLEGDNVLLIVANLLGNYRGEDDNLLVRYRGDEFICVEMLDAIDEVNLGCQRFCEMIQRVGIAFETSSLGVLTVSVGACAMSPNSIRELNKAIDVAYKMLYKAKNLGSNSTCVSANGELS